MLETILDGKFGECEEVAQDYVNECHKLFPLARVFTTPEDLQQKMNGDEKHHSTRSRPHLWGRNLIRGTRKIIKHLGLLPFYSLSSGTKVTDKQEERIYTIDMVAAELWMNSVYREVSTKLQSHFVLQLNHNRMQLFDENSRQFKIWKTSDSCVTWHAATLECFPCDCGAHVEHVIVVQHWGGPCVFWQCR